MAQNPSRYCYDLDTTTLDVVITDTDGNAVDITGHTVSWIFSGRQAYVSKLQIDVTDHDDVVRGMSSLTITPANIVTIGGPGSYDLFCVDTDEDGVELTRLEYKLVVRRRPALS